MRIVRAVGITAAAAIALAAGGAWLIVAASLPRNTGAVPVPGLDDAVEIRFDARGIPQLHATTIDSAFRAQGFVHAQQRYFQMDLIRRSAAGELTLLFGDRARSRDRTQIAFEFRRRAREHLARLPARHRAWLVAYSEGVNAGLDDLGARPPEYWLLGQRPQAWRPEDSLLVVFAIYTMLSNNEAWERSQAVMAATLPAEVVRFLTPTTSRDDRPLLAGAADPTGGYTPLAVPGPASLDLRLERDTPPPGIVDPPMMGPAASNQWAIDARRSSTGYAILANDPHLGFQLPNLFYRAEIHLPVHAVRGVSVPGLPGILIGASDAIAWGATVSYADQSDWVVIEPDPADAGRYLTPDGSEAFDAETIQLPGDDEPVTIRRSRYGPVVATDGLGRPLALKATWLEPDGLSLDLLELNLASSLTEALDILSRWAGPALSWSLADDDGAIAWTLNGPLPLRTGFDGSTPVGWHRGERYWSGYAEPPVVTSPADGRVRNANDRALPMPAAAALSRVYMRPHRAARIDALLDGDAGFDEDDLFRMQLDTSAPAYEPLRRLILEIVADDEPDAALAAARRAAVGWNGRADTDSAAFPLLQRFFRALLGRSLAPLLTPALQADPNFVYNWPLAEEAMYRLLDERPAHLLPATFASWPDFLRDVLRDAQQGISERGSWGAINRLDVGHPFAGLPLVGRRLRLAASEQPGSPVSLRVATPTRGAVFRMVVSPSSPESGILQLFGGQSGHPLSPNFADQQEDWAAGVPTPFVAGPVTHSFTLTPPAR